MKYILLLFFFLSTILQAEYLRTIRIATFNTKIESTQALQELKSFIQEQKNVVELQKEWDFKFKARRSGKYYITLVEPLTQRKVLQEVIDTLRISYPDVYVTRLKTKKQKKVIVPTPVIIEKIKKKSVPLFIKEETVVPKQVIKKVIPEILEHIEKPKEIHTPLNIKKIIETNEEKNPKKEDVTVFNENFLLIFILALSGVFFFTLKKLLHYKKENEVYFNSELIHNEKYQQLSLEIKDREKYLSHASHELRAPMTAIMGLTHLVLDSDIKKQERDYIKQIENSATNLLNIVNDILDVSKIKAGELHIEKVEFNINDILEYVLNIVSMQAKNNNINCIIDIDPEVPSHIIGDSLRLGQVLVNLLGNAVKFTKDGEVSLAVKKATDYGDVVSLEFIVSDDGIGMTKEQVGNIFHSFTQADNSTTRKFGGTGLGLSISQELVKMMHGEIKVTSEVGKGTSFSFTIAFKLKDHLNKRQYRLPSEKYLNKRILLVDSSNKNVMQLINMLGYFKYKTHTIPSFEESILDTNIVFDIVIINKNQLSTLTIAILTKLQTEQKFKIVILNELFSSLDNQVLQNFNVNAYLKIPFNQQNILNMIIDLYATKKLDTKSRVKKPKDILQNIAPKKILIAEDNEVNHKVISGLFINTNISLTFVLNGREAIKALEGDTAYDLILMDINMPIMNGYEASKEIRKHTKFEHIPIFALTADVMDEAIRKAFDAGMQGHISKPIIIDIFYKKIHDVLVKKKKRISPRKTKEIVLKSIDDDYQEISISVGLQRYNNDKEFYNSILKDFKKMYINSPLELTQLCRIEKYKEARHKAMDIKDVCLGIGAYNLCESAAAMEYNLEKGSRSNWEQLIASYEIELGKLFSNIDNYLKKDYS